MVKRVGIIIILLIFQFNIFFCNFFNTAAAPSQATIELDYYYAEGVNLPSSDRMVRIPGPVKIESIGVGPNVQEIEVELMALTNVGWRAGVSPSYFLFEPPEYLEDRFNVMVTIPLEAPAFDIGTVNVSGTATTYQTSIVYYIDPVEAQIKNKPFMICEGTLDKIYNKALPGESLDMLLKIHNLGNFEDKFSIRLSSSSSALFPHLAVTFNEDEVKIPRKSFYEVKLTIDIPDDAETGAYDLVFDITNTGMNDPESVVHEKVSFQITIEKQGFFGIGNWSWIIVIVLILGTIIFGLWHRRRKKIIVRRVR